MPGMCIRRFSRDRGETEAFEISTEARPNRRITALRDGLETEVSRPRPHLCDDDDDDDDVNADDDVAAAAYDDKVMRNYCY